MCGDGANDCGALKAAHVGISLSESEASVASPFTSREPNISCVPQVIKEGRAALVTSFGVFKFMVCYSLAEFASVIILYGIDSNLSNVQFLFIDIFLVLHFASTFGFTEAWDKFLAKKPPMMSLLSFVPLSSITLQMFVVISFQVVSYHLIQSYDWFEPFVFVEGENYLKCYETFAVFTVSMFQYIILALVFSKGKPYRKPVYTNLLFILSIVLMILVCSYLTLIPGRWFIDLLDFRVPPKLDFGLMVLFLAFLNLIAALFMEDFVVEYLLQRKVFPKFRDYDKHKKYIKYAGMEVFHGADPRCVVLTRENENELGKGSVNLAFEEEVVDCTTKM